MRDRHILAVSSYPRVRGILIAIIVAPPYNRALVMSHELEAPPMMAEPEPRGILPIVLAAVCGLGVGIALGLGIASIGGRSPAEVLTEKETLAKENEELRAEKSRVVHPIEPARPEARTERAPESHDPEETKWKAGREIVRVYGPSSPFSGFAQRLEATGWWNPGAHWTLRGNVGLLPEGIGLQLNDPLTRIFAGHLSVSVDKKDNESSPEFTPVLKLDLARLFLMGDKHSSTLQGACEAIAHAMEFNDQEIRRIRKVAGIVPRVPPQQAIDGMAVVAEKLPTKQRETFAQKLNRLARCMKSKEWKELLTGDTSEPAVNFDLSPRYVTNLCFGDYAERKDGPPPAWSLTITNNTMYSRDPAWVQLSEAELDSIAND